MKQKKPYRLQERAHRIIAMLVMVTMLISIMVPVKTAEATSVKRYTDIKGNKYETALNYAVKYDLLSGKGTKLSPNSKIKRGEVVTAFVSLLGASIESSDIKKVSDVKKGSTYYNVMAAALNARLITPDSSKKLYPEKIATQQYVAKIISQISGTPVKEILGKKKATQTLTKGEFAKLLKDFAPNIVTKSTSKAVKGNVVVNTPDVTLKNMTITGNLIIGDGVGSKEVTLKNVIVKGKTIVRGGGENSIIITGTSDLSSIIIQQVNNKVSIKVKGDAKVSLIYINDGSNDVNIVGNVGSLTIAGEGIHVTAQDAVIEEVILSGANTQLDTKGKTEVGTVLVEQTAKNAVVNAAEGTSIGKVEINAENTSLVNEGVIKEVKVDAPNVWVDTNKDTKVEVGDNGSLATEKKEEKPSGNEKPSSGNSGGSGNETNGGNNNGNNNNGNTGNNENDKDKDNDSGIKYVTDERFETGYPMVMMKQEDKTIHATIKLKEGVASPENPAMVYAIASSANSFIDADTQAVIHGHAGTDYDIDGKTYHNPIWAEFFESYRIEDDKEVNLDNLEKYLFDGQRSGFTMYFVIVTKEKTSGVPTKISFDKETVGSFADDIEPYPYGIYLNNAKDKIYIYFNEELDENSIPNVNEFAIQNISIDEVRVVNTDEENHYWEHYIELSISGGENIDIENAKLSYSGVSIQDIANIPNKTQSFINDIQLAVPKIKAAYASEDGKYISFMLEGIIYNYNNIKPTVNGSDNYMYGVSYSIERQQFNLYKNDAQKSASYMVGIKSTEDIYTYARDKVENLSALTLEASSNGTIEFTHAELVKNKNSDFERIEIKGIITGNGDYINYYMDAAACNFVLIIDGAEYRLSGYGGVYSYMEYENNTSIILCIPKESYKHIDLTNVSSFQIKYAPFMYNIPYMNHQYLSDSSGKPIDGFTVNGTVK